MPAHHSSGWHRAGLTAGVPVGNSSLVRRLRAGDRQAAAEIVDLYYRQIYLYMRRLGHSRQVSEDLTQESFLQAWQHIDQLRDDGALSAWLYRIAGNASRLYWRRHRYDKPAAVEHLEITADSGDAGQMGKFEELERLQKAVAALPPKFREVIVLHYMQHLTISEAAEAVSVRPGTFKSRLNRALKALRRQMG